MCVAPLWAGRDIDDREEPELATDRETTDVLFGVRHAMGPTGWTVDAEAGPWLSDGAGIHHPGSFGVLADTAFSMPILYSRSHDHVATVTTTLALDFVHDARALRGPFSGEATLVTGGDQWGAAQGIIRGAEGRVVAVGSLTGVQQVVPEGFSASRAPIDGIASREPLDSILGLQDLTDLPIPRSVTVHARLANVRGVLHGGVAMALADVLGSRSLPGGPAAWSATSIRLDYARSAIAGSRLEVGVDERHRGRALAIVDVTLRRPSSEVVVAARLSYLARSMISSAAR